MTENEIAKTDMENIQKKVLGCIGLASRARKCIFGTEMCVEYMRKDKGCLLIVAYGISENTKKKLVKTATYHKIPYYISDIDKSILAHSAGKISDTSAILITDKNFTAIIQNLNVEIHITDTEVLD